MLTTTTGIGRARAARETLLTAIGHEPRVRGIRIALTSGGGYRLKVRLVDGVGSLSVPEQVDGVPVLVTAA